MYGYNEYVPLNTEEILKRVSQEDIFKIVIKKDIILDKGALYKAPYRDDNNGDCYFEYFENKLLFVDFGDPDNLKAANNCFFFIKKCLKLDNIYEVCSYINNYFKLGLGDSSGAVKQVNVENSIPVEESFYKNINRNRTITYTPRVFDSKDKKFWSKYGITKQNLIDDKVIPITLYRAFSKKGEPFIIKPFDELYAYTDFSDNKVKIYRPYSPDKQGKWFTNCNQDDIGCIDFLPLSGDLLVITKSYKDCRVLRNQGLNCIWFQNEGMIPNSSIIKMLCKRFTRIVVWFDNDQVGLAKGRMVKDYINSMYPNKATTLTLPPILLLENVKDPSDYVATYKVKALNDFLKLNKLL
jgi:hypothetical protein